MPTISKQAKMILIVILGLVLIGELQWDILEAFAGSVIDLTNNSRPRIGTVWQNTLSREEASEKLGIYAQKEREDSDFLKSIETIPEVVRLLDTRENVLLGREEFYSLYKKLSANQAHDIMPAVTFLEQYINGVFEVCLVRYQNQLIQFVFLDQSSELTFGTSLPRNYFDNSIEVYIRPELDPIEIKFNELSVKKVDAAMFFQAFNAVEKEYRTEIVDDPFFLVKNIDSIQRVALLPLNRDGIIPIIFEIVTDTSTEYHEFQTRALAAYFLMENLRYLETKDIFGTE